MGNSFIDKEELERQEQLENKKTKKRSARKSSGQKKSGFGKLLRQVLNGEILTQTFIVNNLLFLFFIGGLLVLLISKGYYSRQLSNEIDKTQKEIGEINSKLVSNKIKFNNLTDRVNMTEKLNERNLSESESGVQVIRIDE